MAAVQHDMVASSKATGDAAATAMATAPFAVGGRGKLKGAGQASEIDLLSSAFDGVHFGSPAECWGRIGHQGVAFNLVLWQPRIANSTRLAPVPYIAVWS